MTKEALKLALEALEFFSDTSNSAMDKAMSEDAITSLRQAIAEAEKQYQSTADKSKLEKVKANGTLLPEAEKQEKVKPQNCGTSFCSCIECVMETPPPQRQWVGLTDEEYKAIHGKNYNYDELAHAIEAKLKEKNT